MAQVMDIITSVQFGPPWLMRIVAGSESPRNVLGLQNKNAGLGFTCYLVRYSTYQYKMSVPGMSDVTCQLDLKITWLASSTHYSTVYKWNRQIVRYHGMRPWYR